LIKFPTISFILISLISNQLEATSIYIYNYEMNQDHREIAEKFMSSFEKNDTKRIFGLLNKERKINTNRIEKYSSINNGRSWGILSFNECKGDTLKYKRVYSKVENGNRSFLFQVTITLNKSNPYIIDQVKIDDEIRLPKKLKRLLKKLDNEKTSDKKKKNIAISLKPQAPLESNLFENYNGFDNSQTIYLSNLFDNKLSNFNANQLNEINLPIKWYIHVEKDLQKIYLLKELKLLRVLTIYLYEDNSVNIPESISELKTLEELQIYCKNCQNLPQSIRRLKNLKLFNYHGNKLNKDSQKLVLELETELKKK